MRGGRRAEQSSVKPNEEPCRKRVSVGRWDRKRNAQGCAHSLKSVVISPRGGSVPGSTGGVCVWWGLKGTPGMVSSTHSSSTRSGWPSNPLRPFPGRRSVFQWESVLQNLVGAQIKGKKERKNQTQIQQKKTKAKPNLPGKPKVKPSQILDPRVYVLKILQIYSI